MNLSKEVKITKVKAASATGTTEVTSDVVDMAGFEGVIFLTNIGSFNAGNFLKGQQDTVVGMGTVQDLEGSKVVATANGETVFLDIYKPKERFVRASVIRAGATTVLGEIYALQYSGRVSPVDNDTVDVLLGSLLISPDEGIA